jgi:hypothetical protein
MSLRPHLDAMYAAFKKLQDEEDEAFARGLLIFDNVFARRQGLVADLDRGFSLAPWMQNRPNTPPPPLEDSPERILQRLRSDIEGKK